MIVEYIRYQIGEERQTDFLAAYRTAGESLIASPHCLRYELTRCTEDSTAYILRIEWDSLDGHLQGFRQSPEFRTFLASVGPFVNDIAEMRHYQLTEIKGERS